MPGNTARDGKSRKTLARTLVTAWRRHVRPLWRDLEVPVFIIMGIAAFVLGFVGYRIFLPERTVPDTVFMTIQLFRLMFFQSGPFPWELEVARWLALLVIMYAALRVITAIFYEQVSLVALRLLARDHVIITAPGPEGMKLAKAFSDRGYTVAVVEKALPRDAVQRYREIGVIAVNGDPGDPVVLRKARAGRAGYLIAVATDDGTNAETALHARELSRGRTRPLFCYAHIGDRRLCNQLAARFGLETMGHHSFRIEFINTSEMAARALIEEYPPFTGATAEIVTAGLNSIGESFIFLAAARWLSAPASPGKRLMITLVDCDASAKKAGLVGRYPVLETACEIAAIDRDPLSPALPEGWLPHGAPGNVYVFKESDTIALSTAMSVAQVARDRACNIVVCTGQQSGLTKLITSGGADNIRVFVADRVYRPDAILSGAREVLAREIHARYVAGQQRLGASPLENPSMAPWEDLPETLKEANRANADDIHAKLAFVGCRIELLTDAAAVRFELAQAEVEQLAIQEHQRWVGERRAVGWTYAPGPKDIDKKLTPYLVPWEDLPEEIREYDRNVVRGIPRFLAGAGFQICRVQPGDRRPAPAVKVPLPER